MKRVAVGKVLGVFTSNITTPCRGSIKWIRSFCFLQMIRSFLCQMIAFEALNPESNAMSLNSPSNPSSPEV